MVDDAVPDRVGFEGADGDDAVGLGVVQQPGEHVEGVGLATSWAGGIEVEKVGGFEAKLAFGDIQGVFHHGEHRS